ncbi:unnamed protein product [Haemonchus placei]|uniref:Ovule protein n=1 Tax=Haemonchus placei TaxID=6290 RepID=A0A0N4WHU3_HAEPC|nr:unnamed protein product [Haemonchus placei]
MNITYNLHSPHFISLLIVSLNYSSKSPFTKFLTKLPSPMKYVVFLENQVAIIIIRQHSYLPIEVRFHPRSLLCTFGASLVVSPSP